MSFHFSEECLKTFNSLKEALTSSPIRHAPIWEEPFELMYNASDYAVGVVVK